MQPDLFRRKNKSIQQHGRPYGGQNRLHLRVHNPVNYSEEESGNLNRRARLTVAIDNGLYQQRDQKRKLAAHHGEQDASEEDFFK
ncbi:hypothetical protein D3C80_1790370 [compost metagenome]